MSWHDGQMMGDNLKSSTQALEVHRRLLPVYGAHLDRQRSDPVSELVNTIISQNTNDRLRDQAFGTLRQRFPAWEQVCDAPVAEVVDAIRIAGLGQTKAPRIQAALRRIYVERGEYDLHFLRDMGVEGARKWLLEIKGVGPKTVAILLLFALDLPAFPVDTHIWRVSKRLGLIPEKTSREKAHELLEAMLPPEAYYAAHLNIIRLGREVCHARKPRCELCVLRGLCQTYRGATAPQA
jgi:endonuclease III